MSETVPLDRWWATEYALHRGVFQGGGAKGIAYAGALRAFKAAHCWFSAAAGSSAGALTATLVAAGLTPDEMIGELENGLLAIRRRGRFRAVGDHLSGLLGEEAPIYSTDRLRDWLEGVLRKRCSLYGGVAWDTYVAGEGSRRDPDVTFKDLWLATQIDLFVVALDIDSGVPVVLSRYSAADCQVSWAATASSSIPAIMSQKQLVMQDHAYEWRVTRLVDGGAWANFPRFVFTDPAFAAYHGSLEATAWRTAGFILRTDVALVDQRPRQRTAYYFVESAKHSLGKAITGPSGATSGEGVPIQTQTTTGPATVEAAPTRPIRRLARVASSWLAGLLAATAVTVGLAESPSLLGWICLAVAALATIAFAILNPKPFLVAILTIAQVSLKWRPLRVIGTLGIAAALAIGFIFIAAYFFPQALDATSAENGGDDWVTAVLFLIFVALMSFLLTLSLAVLAFLRFNRFLAIDAAPTLGASLGAATRVPAWLEGDGHDEIIFRVPVKPTVRTTEFDIATDKRDAVIESARQAVAAQIERWRASESTPFEPEVGGVGAPLTLENPEADQARRSLVNFVLYAFGFFIPFLWPWLLIRLLKRPPAQPPPSAQQPEP